MKNAFLISFFLCMLCYVISCNKKNIIKNSKNINYSLSLDRGGFHYDCFELTPTALYFYPNNEIDSFYLKKYRTFHKVEMDTAVTLAFFRELEARGIWNLKEYYEDESSDTSGLRVIFKADDRETIIECDDYIRSCPELIHYIEEKIIELEGNDLKRIYLPG